MGNARNLADNLPVEGSLSGRNLLINGGFQVFQRSSAVTTADAGFQGYYTTADRWKIYENTQGAFTTERSTDTPSGSGSSFKAVVTTAATALSTNHYASIEQIIEAQNCQHLAYGTSAAKTLTLSFFVKSSKTGIYTIALYKPDTTGYLYTKEYTINSANTWEKKTINITPTAGSTSFITSSGGAIANDNGQGLILGFNLAWGDAFDGGTSDVWSSSTSNYSTTNQLNWMDTVGNTFILSEVQLEVGSQSTPFEHRSFGDELARCQRYYQKSVQNGSTSYPSSDGYARGMYLFPVRMRNDPTGGYTDAGGGGSVIGNETNTDGFFVTYQSLAASQAGAFSWTMDAEL